MLDQLLGNAGHVSRIPCKHIDVSTEEADQRVFLFGVQMGPNLGRLALATDHELNLLCVFGLSCRSRWLLSWDRLLLHWDLLGVGDASLYSGREIHRISDGESFSFVVVGGGDVGTQGENALFYQDLQHQVDIMGHDHELGESWSAKDGVVGGIEFCHKEVHVLNTEVVGGAN